MIKETPAALQIFCYFQDDPSNTDVRHFHFPPPHCIRLLKIVKLSLTFSNFTAGFFEVVLKKN